MFVAGGSNPASKAGQTAQLVAKMNSFLDLRAKVCCTVFLSKLAPHC